MIPAKKKAVPIFSLADKENVVDNTGGGRGSRTSSRKAKALIKVYIVKSTLWKFETCAYTCSQGLVYGAPYMYIRL